MEDNLIAVTADVKPCPHGFVFIDLCCDCLKDMLNRALRSFSYQLEVRYLGQDMTTFIDEDIREWWNYHKEHNNGTSIP